MGFHFNPRKHAPQHNLGEVEKKKWLDDKFQGLHKTYNTKEEINPKSWKIPDFESEVPLPRPNNVPVIFVSRNYSSECKIEFNKDWVLAEGNTKGFELELVIVPERDYNYKSIIGGHTLFIHPTSDGKNHLRYCDRLHCGVFMNDVLDAVEDYLHRHGDVIYV